MTPPNNVSNIPKNQIQGKGVWNRIINSPPSIPNSLLRSAIKMQNDDLDLEHGDINIIEIILNPTFECDCKKCEEKIAKDYPKIKVKYENSYSDISEGYLCIECFFKVLDLIKQKNEFFEKEVRAWVEKNKGKIVANKL